MLTSLELYIYPSQVGFVAFPDVMKHVLRRFSDFRDLHGVEYRRKPSKRSEISCLNSSSSRREPLHRSTALEFELETRHSSNYTCFLMVHLGGSTEFLRK